MLKISDVCIILTNLVSRLDTSEILSICSKKNFVKPHEVSTQSNNRKNGNKNCQNELKFCEVSQNSFSNRCWKFQLSIYNQFTKLRKNSITQSCFWIRSLAAMKIQYAITTFESVTWYYVVQLLGKIYIFLHLNWSWTRCRDPSINEQNVLLELSKVICLITSGPIKMENDMYWTKDFLI